MTIGILHTTESRPGTGAAVDGYFVRNPSIQPNVLYDPSDGYQRVYFPAGVGSKALFNAPGGVETNNRPGGVFQIEIVGHAADVGGYSDEWYANLRLCLLQWSTIAGIDYKFYTGSKLTFVEWSNATLSGWFGHDDVPENNHTDPGTLDFTRLLTPQGPKVPALEDSTQIQYHDGGDRSLPPKSAPVTSALGWTVDSAAQAESWARATYAAVLKLQPVKGDIRVFSTAELLAELVRRQAS